MTTDALLGTSDLPHQLPRFADIEDQDYAPAIEAAMAEQLAAVAAISADPAPPTFANTLVPLELSGVTLARVLRVFWNKASADANPQIDAVRAAFAPRLAAHGDAILLDPALWARLRAVDADRAGLDPEAAYLVERYVTEFRLAGAALGDDDKARLRALNERISSQETAFELALQADSNDLAVVVDDPASLAGLTPGEVSAAAAAAEARGLTGRHLLTLVLPTAHPHLASLTDRDLRRRLSEAQRSRGSRGGEHDTRAVALDILRLRAERARLLGFDNHAAAVTADNTAGTPKAVRSLLERLAIPAARNARAEQDAMSELAGFPVEPWDWPFYAERVRSARYDVDLAALRPWFESERVLRDGVFFAAGRLYGLAFEERPDLPGYHPDVRVFEVSRDGTPIGLYLLDLYTRDAKRGGAWMSSFVTQSGLLGVDTSVVVNNLNVPKPAAGEATLLTWDETRTLFHEFGHALHGLLARATYPKFGGTAVFRDFVEYPSQVNEMWVLWPEVLASYAVHHETGEPIPADVVERLRAAETFNEGFATSGYLAAALLDLAWHELGPDDVPTDPAEVAGFEQRALAAAGLDNPAVPPRYSTPYFAHSFSSGYAAAYYSYIWSEVLDADTVAWFRDNGGLTRENGEAYLRHVIGIGGTRDPLESYEQWRGRPAPIEPLLTRRGLA
ncbi:M3 family metallopeptidase [Nocardioides daeguensis]|uniref:M3 family metallopeptidase n=1 Tax=Nocardioides daeguensis TaxID=908359 RepID=A0ABP6VS31_9ACTN|nr:M3 family metallopeptidase [Nocardioides daeguensis]MBV6727571.1 M3 family metallopeptidase [Nocardioides daeguensis]MCR1773207.1 M3 family metallopeptidase [Nocardioides daeguensis]